MLFKPNIFRRHANTILNDLELVVDQSCYKITEISFHSYSNNHMDPWVYKRDGQLNTNNWLLYYRRDEPDQPMIEMVFGNRDQKKYSGVLIRGIHEINKSGSGDKIYGPVNVAKKVIDLLGVSSAEAIGQYSGQNLNNPHGKFFIRTKKISREPRDLHESPRKNLSWNKKDADPFRKLRFRMENYRFFTYPELVYEYDAKKKDPALLWLSLFLSGASINIVNANSSDFLEEFGRGLSRDMSTTNGIPRYTSSVYWECRLLGAWYKYQALVK